MPREARQARNQDLFRAVNDQIADLSSSIGEKASCLFICECWQLGCTAQIDLPLHEYAKLREADGAFIVLAGHEDSDQEIVLADHGTYRIVQHDTRNSG